MSWPPARAIDRTADSDVVRIDARAAMAERWVCAGRHAAAERLLREAAAALERRRAWARATCVWLRLGQLLLDRGRAGDACRAFEAAVLAARDGADASAWDARVWHATALTDAGQLVRAESLVLAALDVAPSGAHAAWAAAALTEVRVWQRRWTEVPAVDHVAGGLGTLECVPRAMVGASAVRGLLIEGRIFDAGQRAAAGLREVASRETTNDNARQASVAWAIALTARLRVLCAAGDLDLASGGLDTVLSRSRDARVPVHAMRARLIFADALGRAGRSREAQMHWRRLRRAAVALPPLLRDAVARREAGSALDTPGAATIDEAGVPAMWRSMGSSPTGRTAPPAASHTASLTTSLAAPLTPFVAASLTTTARSAIEPPAYLSHHMPHGDADDHEAVRKFLASVATGVGASRLDVLPLGPAGDHAAPLASVPTLVAAGHARDAGHSTGLQSGLASLVCQRGAAVGPLPCEGGWEIGVPVWFLTRRIAVVVGRWEGVRPPDAALDTIALAAAVAAPRVAAIVSRATGAVVGDHDIPELVGTSTAIASVRAALVRAARAPFAVLIEGESGVGKELAARAIHRLSPRHTRPFGDVNCAALPDELVDAELFGHARGAFTGAVADRAGLFESADGGTLFLDEVAELSPRAQAKLLRVLQQQEVRRVGEAASRRVDVRIVSAANRDLRASVAAGLFRHDLLYRLDVIRVQIPPLRERPEDVPVLARRLWEVLAAKTGSKALPTDRVFDALQHYHWPGNVRELQNVLASLAVAAPAAGVVDVAHLPAWVRPTSSAVVPLAGARAAFERSMISDALDRAGGHHGRAAHALGISRQGLAKMCARLGVAGEHRQSLAQDRDHAGDHTCDHTRDDTRDNTRDDTATRRIN